MKLVDSLIAVFLAALLLFIAHSARADWTPKGQCYTFDGGHGPAQPPSIGFPDTFRTPMPGAVRSYDMNNLQWNAYDVTELGIPATATSVTFQGIMIITHGTMAEICNMQLFLRKPGAPYWSVQAQVVEAAVGNGIRSGVAASVELDNGYLEWAFIQYGGATGWPNTCSFTNALWVAEWCH